MLTEIIKNLILIENEREFGKIANPVVHQTLNELRKLINEIITVFAKKPLEIGLETTRELKKARKIENIYPSNKMKTNVLEIGDIKNI